MSVPSEIADKLNTACGLLDLPDAILDPIITGLTRLDQIRFMAASRCTARLVAKNANYAILKVTQDTKFTGLKQVLDWFPSPVHLEIICPHGTAENSQPAPGMPMSPVDMFIRMTPSQHLTQIASNCRWENVKKVTIQGTNLRCLVPPLLEAACPQLSQLTIAQPEPETPDVFVNEYGKALALPICRRLTQIHLDYDVLRNGTPCTAIEPLPAFHNIAELAVNLPNLDTLVMRTPYPVFIDTFATQLTRLEVGKHSVAVEQVIRRCSKLQHLSAAAFVLPDKATALEVLEMKCCLCSDNNLKKLLQLPSLTTLRLFNPEPDRQLSFPDSKQDWSGYKCSLRELHLDDTRYFVTLKNLNMSSLKVLSTGSSVDFALVANLTLISLLEWRFGPNVDVHFPDPRNPDCLLAVQRAVDYLSHIGKLVLQESEPDGCVWFGGCGTITWWLRGVVSTHQQRVAEMVAIAAQHIGPVRICNCEHIVAQPLVLQAVVDWGQSFIESVCLGHAIEPMHYVWLALQQLQRLNTVVFWDSGHFHAFYGTTTDGVVNSIVCSAAQHYVIPSNRSLRLEFVMSNKALQQAQFEEGRPKVTADIEKNLPAGSKLASFDVWPTRATNCLYGRKNVADAHADAFWVIVLAPLYESV